MGLAVDFGFAILHGKRSPSGMRLFAETHYTAKCRRFLVFLIMRSVILLKGWISPV
jgi:hypothetical protein